jgi:hypothetical protein
MDTEPKRDPATSTRINRLVVVQLCITVVSIAIFSYIGFKIQPLLEQKNELERQIKSSQAVLEQLNAAIKNSKDPVLARQAETIQLQTLSGFKLGIYFLAGNANGQKRATELASKLRETGYPGAIELHGNKGQFFEDYGRPTTDQIRYELDYELAQARALQSLLGTIDPAHHFTLDVVNNRTPNFISIFLIDGFE